MNIGKKYYCSCLTAGELYYHYMVGYFRRDSETSHDGDLQSKWLSSDSPGPWCLKVYAIFAALEQTVTITV